MAGRNWKALLLHKEIHTSSRTTSNSVRQIDKTSSVQRQRFHSNQASFHDEHPLPNQFTQALYMLYTYQVTYQVRSHLDPDKNPVSSRRPRGLSDVNPKRTPSSAKRTPSSFLCLLSFQCLHWKLVDFIWMEMFSQLSEIYKVMEWKTNEFLSNCWNIRFIQMYISRISHPYTTV